MGGWVKSKDSPKAKKNGKYQYKGVFWPKINKNARVCGTEKVWTIYLSASFSHFSSRSLTQPTDYPFELSISFSHKHSFSRAIISSHVSNSTLFLLFEALAVAVTLFPSLSCLCANGTCWYYSTTISVPSIPIFLFLHHSPSATLRRRILRQHRQEGVLSARVFLCSATRPCSLTQKALAFFQGHFFSPSLF